MKYRAPLIMLCFIALITCRQIFAAADAHYVKATVVLVKSKNQILLDLVSPILNISQSNSEYKEIFANSAQMDYMPFLESIKTWARNAYRLNEGDKKYNIICETMYKIKENFIKDGKTVDDYIDELQKLDFGLADSTKNRHRQNPYKKIQDAYLDSLKKYRDILLSRINEKMGEVDISFDRDLKEERRRVLSNQLQKIIENQNIVFMLEDETFEAVRAIFPNENKPEISHFFNRHIQWGNNATPLLAVGRNHSFFCIDQKNVSFDRASQELITTNILKSLLSRATPVFKGNGFNFTLTDGQKAFDFCLNGEKYNVKKYSAQAQLVSNDVQVVFYGVESSGDGLQDYFVLQKLMIE